MGGIPFWPILYLESGEAEKNLEAADRDLQQIIEGRWEGAYIKLSFLSTTSPWPVLS